MCFGHRTQVFANPFRKHDVVTNVDENCGDGSMFACEETLPDNAVFSSLIQTAPRTRCFVGAT